MHDRAPTSPKMPPGQNYPGGKGASGVTQRIISAMPWHRTYIEPFLGKSPILRAKRPAEETIGIDLDPAVVAWWRQLAPPRVTILRGDAMRILSTSPAMQDPAVCVYCDPPYLLDTRTRLLYACEFETAPAHTALLEALLDARCSALISHYPCPLYFRLLKNWRCIEYQTMTRGGLRHECLWANFDPPAHYHDTTFCGDGYRERERIKKKRQRWAARFAGMDDAERQAVREALDQVAPPATAVGAGNRYAATIEAALHRP